MRLLNDPQGSEAWLKSRAGKFTASTASDLMAQGRGGAPSTSRANLITKLAVERITGTPVQGFQSEDMRRGNELEPFARAAYEAETGAMVQVVGFALHDEFDFAGASMDGLVLPGNIEIKCPSAQDKHYQALMTGAHAQEYAWQVAFQQWIGAFMWTDVGSYDPRFPEGLQLAIVRVPRDNSRISDIRSAVIKAEDEVQSRVNNLLSRRK
jgi:predicted phage-related endonuclease